MRIAGTQTLMSPQVHITRNLELDADLGLKPRDSNMTSGHPNAVATTVPRRADQGSLTAAIMELMLQCRWMAAGYQENHSIKYTMR